MTKLAYPKALRVRLREYVMLSEPVFRFNYYSTLLDKLSPSLQALVAQQDHGAERPRGRGDRERQLGSGK